MASQPAPSEINIVRVVRYIIDLFQGRSNAVGEFTLSNTANTTIVTAINCGEGSKPQWTPTTPNAATESASGVMYTSSVERGQFTVFHSIVNANDRLFHYTCHG